MEEKKSKPEFIKMIIDTFTVEEKEEFAELLRIDLRKDDEKIRPVNNKIELQVG